VREASRVFSEDVVEENVIGLRAVVPRQSKSHEGFSHDVAIVGMGYVGLPTSLAFTSAGASVIGIELSQARLEQIRAGCADLLPSDQERLDVALKRSLLSLSTSAEALRNAATVIVCVPTPVDHHLVPDLSLLTAACATVVANAQPGQVLLLTSTSYVGTTRDLLVDPLRDRGLDVGEDVFVAFSPERIDPGNTGFLQESVPRVVGGVTSECSIRAVKALGAYATTLHVVSSPEAAELTKLYENLFRAVNIALVNELADLSRDLQVDVIEVIDAASTKPYGFMPFTPGSGVGGHCIPCDPHYLLWQLKLDQRTAPVIEQAMSSIAQRPRQVVDRIRELLGDVGCGLRGARVLIVGAAYKPGVADMRESPAIEILSRLHSAGADVRYIDPLVPELRLSDGSWLRSSTSSPHDHHDLVVLNTIHPGVDYDWVADHLHVLDTTYRFAQIPQRALL
jgi:UDP-N-acetyl-D-glucosamine dehydrogenase